VQRATRRQTVLELALASKRLHHPRSEALTHEREQLGAILEQSQILTTFNLATLVHGLDLQPELAGRAHGLATKVFDWIVDRHRRMPKDFLPRLRVIKNTAYAWRQALFFLSFAPEDHQQRAHAHLQARLTASDEASKTRLGPVAAGLALILDGQTFDANGVGPRGERRLLGWSCGRHFMMPAKPAGSDGSSSPSSSSPNSSTGTN
jgi:hypothetical protein